jgi:hypothetical protein
MFDEMRRASAGRPGTEGDDAVRPCRFRSRLSNQPFGVLLSRTSRKLPRCGAAQARSKRSLWVDTVEKGKNEPVKIFACAPVETGFS